MLSRNEKNIPRLYTYCFAFGLVLFLQSIIHAADVAPSAPAQQDNNASFTDLSLMMQNIAKAIASDDQTVKNLQKLNVEPTLFTTHEDASGKHQTTFPNKGAFYNDYIKRYYPKAHVIRKNFFELMTPEQMVNALKDIIVVFSREPSFYFSNKKSMYCIYWELIIDQCDIISDFLIYARIDVQTKKIFPPEKQSQYNSKALFLEQTSSLYFYLKRYFNDTIADFYALSFDYVIKLFNEQILSGHDSFFNRVTTAKRHFTKLQKIFKRLIRTRYESDYQEALDRCQRLLNKLKQQFYVEDDDTLYGQTVLQNIAHKL